MEYARVFLAALPFLFTFIWLQFRRSKGRELVTLPRNWPVLGMVPSLLFNLHRLGDFATVVLQRSHGSFMFKGPWFTKMELLVTADPNNVQYIMSKHHHRFDRGLNFGQIFDVLGDGLFNSDNDMWRYQRKIAHACFTSLRFQRFMAETILHKIEGGLIPLFERSFIEGSDIDLHDIFQRLTGDITWLFLTGHDPKFLLYENDHSSSIHLIRELSNVVKEAILTRHVLPPCIWRLLKRFRIGKERGKYEFEEAIDNFIYDFIRSKREDMVERSKKSPNHEDGQGADLLSVYIKENYGTEDQGFKSVDVFLRDTFTNFMFAGQDTVSIALAWFFWLIIRHPRVEAKIMDELRDQNISNEECDISQLASPNKLVYLHAAICETLRLYPPVPFNHRSPTGLETLPSGHVVKPNTMIILCTYAMGRMKWVWGDDCEEFKPERWLTEQGTIKHEPSYKFSSFNSGPRICLGKDMSMMQIKAVVCAMMRHNYRFKLVEEHRVYPAPSVVLRMNHGLKVMVTKIQ